MRTSHLLPSCLLALAAMSAARAQDHRPVAFTNARIITVSGETIERGTLVIRHGKIEALGADTAPPAGARIVDASGKTILPGLVCASSNAGLTSTGSARSTSPRSGRSRRNPFEMPSRSSGAENKAATKVVDGLYARQKIFGELLEAGITSLALTPQGNAFPGLGAVLAPDGKTIEELTADDSAFVQITMARDAQTKKLLADNLEKAKKIVEERKKPKEAEKPAEPQKQPEAGKPEEVKPAEPAKGQEPPKPTPTPDPKPTPTPTPAPKPEEKPAEAAKPARPETKPEAKKDPNLELLADLLEGKQRALVAIGSAADLLHWKSVVDDKIEFPRALVVGRHDPYSGTIDLVLDDIKKLGCAVLLPPAMTTKVRTQHMVHPAKILHDAGVEVGFVVDCTKTGARQTFFRLMELVRCGLPADVALKGVTLVPAKALGIDKSTGSLEVGKDANLLVFRGDPLDPEGELDSVWFHGRNAGQQP
ncbi:MAG: amidohydrolase family protein [Planctomycetes bacterium]|nr:amidohydrolase family protein [Planctomycetota bacterium]